MSDVLAALRSKFITRCGEDLALLSTTGATEAERRMVIHRIAGAAGMFGFGELGVLAGRLDDQAADGREMNVDDLATLLAALEAVR